ncbi:hypothetical protein GH5_07118 [Leishmania sp. Ghana 2012 LV757]|uniref:hypothetical protein n=1 Tax=Leishmania sp. Ghana 2012 LV757 TaxID=2803181 RepID=UPI001B569222|nr:hypothetical protein GH5_07118 [Leishmania sp. Ghana 2012 LV757]
MNASMAQLEDYRLMEPSPSPPATERAPFSGSHARDSQARYDIHSDDLLWSADASQSSPTSPLQRKSAQRAQSHGENSANPASSEVGLASVLQSRARRTSSMSALASAAGPLSACSLNALPQSSYNKRLTGSLAAVPAPSFTWEEGDDPGHVSVVSDVQAGAEEEEQRRLTQPAAPRWPSAVCQHRNRVSGGSGRGSSMSHQHRSSVLGPDPRDCIDMYDGDVVEEGACVTPLPYDRQQQVPPALDDDLAALVNAGTVDRCRSDSRGQVDLVSKGSAGGVTKEAVDTCDRIESARGAPQDRDRSDDVNASYEFEQVYFYYPATSLDRVSSHESGDGTASVLRRAETPRRSVSGSSSMPRWVLSLAEETPFTPFALSATGVATTPSPFLHVGPAARATATIVSATTEERLKRGDAGMRDGAQQQQMIPVQRVTVHELVVAVLSSSPCTGLASGTNAPVPAAAPTPMANAADEAKDAPEGHTEESLPHRPPDCEEEALLEEERLCQRVHDTRVRLAFVDQLLARFGIVVAARQAELEKLREKQAVVAQQAESFKSRAAISIREVRRLRERQHGQDEVRLLCNMLADKENRLRVAQSQLVSLQSMWKQLQLLHSATAATTEGSADEGANHVPSPRAAGAKDSGSVPCLSMPTAHQGAADEAQPTDSAEDPQEKEKTPPSPISSVASLETCEVLSDFLEELLSEVDELAKVCIQLPSAPSVATLSSCNRTGRPAAKHRSGAADQRPQRSQTPPPLPSYTALNRRRNDGCNGFFSFFGGATEAHLDSKPLSTFLAGLDRLARTAWEREEELQLRVRELATEEEEEYLKARLSLEYGVKLQQPQTPRRLSGSIDNSVCAGEKMNALSSLSPAALSSERGEERLCSGGANGAPVIKSPISFLASPSDAITGSTDHATHLLSLSSPEHGRRSRYSNAGHHIPSGTASSPLSASSSLLHHRATPTPLLLPTLIYAYPRVAVVSQKLDAEQQQIQADYAAAIEAERQSRRHLTSRLRDTYRQYVAPTLRRTIDALRREQTSLARQFAELGVKAVLIQWEEVDEVEVDDTVLLRAMDSATAAAQKAFSRNQRRGLTKGRSLSRANPKVCECVEREDSYGDAVSSLGTSRARSETDGLRKGAAATPPPCRVYQRTLRVTCAAACERGSTEGEGETEIRVSSQPPSARDTCDAGRDPRQSTTRRPRSSARTSAAPDYLSARSTCKLPSSASHPSATPAKRTPATCSAGLLTATSSKACAALQLCTHPPAKALLPGCTDARNAAEETEGCAAAAVASITTASAGGTASLRRAPVSTTVTPIATSSVRRSGGTPRVSCATLASTTTRTSTAAGSGRSSKGYTSAAMPRSPRQSCECTAASSCSATSQQHRCSRLGYRAVAAHADRFAAPCSSPQNPVVEDVRELVVEADSAYAASTRVTMATPTAANLWSPFAHTQKALSDGAVRVVVTFTGEEARRRQAAQARQEAYQREFWELREELARIDEDIFQLRTRWKELQRTKQRAEAEHRAKLVEAEAKVRKCRAFYKSLRRENMEWQAIHGELEQAVLGKEGR